MRRFVVEAVVDGLIVVVLVFVLSLIHVNQPFPFGLDSAPIVQPLDVGPLSYFLWAAALIIVNRLARPVLVALFGRLIFSTLGLFVIVINALAIWIVGLIDPIDIAVLASPQLLWLLLVAVLFTLLSAFVDAVLGLNRPYLPEPHRRSVWRLLESLPTPRRNAILENLRLQQVYEALYSTSLDIGLAKTPIGGVRRWFAQHILGRPPLLEEPTAPQRVRLMLQELGPTYVKIGQMLAARTDMLPKEWTDEFARLQSDAAPFAWEDARAMIVGELGRPPEELYGSFDTEPFAAASTAQVHRATLLDGTPVAVKVQRPRIVAKTKADLGVMQELARVAERRLDIARRIDLRGIVAEFAAGVLKELDYRNEAYYARRMADGMARFEDIHIPVVYDDLSSTRILTMEFVKGIKISHADELREAGFDTTVLGSTFIRAIIKQVLIDGFFHGDPHPGNVLADPDSKRIVFLDLGLVGQLKPEQRVDLLGLVYAIKSVDIPGIADSLIALGKPTPGFDEAQFRSEIDRLARQYLVYSTSTSLGGALAGMLSAVFNNGLRLDTQLTLAIKAVVQAEETARALSFDIDLGEVAVEEARAALLAQLSPENITRQIQGRALRVGKEVARRAPSIEGALIKWLDVINRGKIVVEVDTSDLGRSIGKVGDVGRQATVGLIVVGQLIGTAIVMAILLQPSMSQFVGVAYVAMIAFGVTLIVSFIVLFRVFFEPQDADDPGRDRR